MYEFEKIDTSAIGSITTAQKTLVNACLNSWKVQNENNNSLKIFNYYKKGTSLNAHLLFYRTIKNKHFS